MYIHIYLSRWSVSFGTHRLRADTARREGRAFEVEGEGDVLRVDQVHHLARLLAQLKRKKRKFEVDALGVTDSDRRTRRRVVTDSVVTS